MNNYKYSKKFDVFVGEMTEAYQISNMDIIVSQRNIAGFAVIKIVFGWMSEKNPLYKIKQES